MNNDKYILETTSQFQSILLNAQQFQFQFTEPLLVQLKEISTALQTLLERHEGAQNHIQSPDAKLDMQDIDDILKSSVQSLNCLSHDAQNTLRTAEMLFIQSRDWNQDAIDLSPIINMYCKAIELVMRDLFEPHTDSLVRGGELSQKLETVGFNDSLADKMQEFEDYIAGLPTINSIPHFSKFKLRKMLRAICLYRPGKRFTLDGPKAFALFFLVTARKKCLYHFDGMLVLPFQTDDELFDFIKQVHYLQDNRNRAVHEGLTWEASGKISKMRKQAYSIINTSIKIGLYLQTHLGAHHG